MKEVRFDGKVAIVTGAGGGLGREYASLLAARGANVVVNDSGTNVNGVGASPEPAHTVANEITARGGTAIVDTHSIATLEGGAAIVKTALDRFGRIDVLVNNAGTLRQAPFAELSLADFDAVLAANLRGVFCITQPAWRVMVGQKSGRILNTISGAVFGFPQSAATSAAKAGVIGLTRALAYEGAAHGIRVNAIAPVAATRMTQEIPDAAFRDWMAGHCAPAMVAPTAAWLVHEDCTCTGEFFTVGGGRTARMFLGVARGKTAHEPSLEQIREQFPAILSESGYLVPRTAVDELSYFRLEH